jgi:DNA-directed RNA polymerase subunit RPC12/RpoP
MQVEHVYRCMRCRKEIVVPVSGEFHIMSEIGQDIITDGMPENHYCDKDASQVGKLELVGMNIKT